MISQSTKIQSYQASYPNNELSENLDLKILKAYDIKGQPVLFVWKGRQGKPFVFSVYRSEGDRTAHLEQIMKRAQERHDYKEQKKAERKAFVSTAEIGSIFYSSWGYEQTNVSFYQVIDKPSKHFVIVREVAQETVPDSGASNGMSCSVLAQKDNFLDRSEPMKYKVSPLGNKEGIRINSSESAWLWDGKPQYKSWYY